ncbi:glycerol-3-phosphate 1-O-acyltransferase PlsY [bacterium]|nr:glycerol-3-phosphate 1-O-acyltransferase PlsY [bacterium]
MSLLFDLLTLVTCYLVGAIPTGLLVGRWAAGIDVREHGSKNIGMTNVWRVLGWKLGLLTLLIDAGKGFLVVAFAWRLFGVSETTEILGGLAALMGNFVNVFLGGKGGKGIATSLGVFLALAPIPILLALGGFLIMLALTRYVSVGSITAAIVLGTSGFLVHGIGLRAAVIATVSIIAIYKHKANIQRLLNGTENKVGGRKAPPPPA